MTQTERRIFLIKYLLEENPTYKNTVIQQDVTQQKRLLRSLLNIRMPQPIGDDFLAVQDEYLQNELKEKGITDIADLAAVEEGLYIWQGDITLLKCDGIVNAANSGLTGCYCPCHACIDNCIHTFAGVQLRLECHRIIQKQGYVEPTGKAKITKAYNLPSRYVLHTVGPIISREVTQKDEQLLADCYTECLKLADAEGLKSIAFCCISTGEFHFPNRRAAKIAVETVKNYKTQTNSKIEVIFNVFKDTDCHIYRELLG